MSILDLLLDEEVDEARLKQVVIRRMQELGHVVKALDDSDHDAGPKGEVDEEQIFAAVAQR